MAEKSALIVGCLMIVLVAYLFVVASLPDYFDSNARLLLYLIGILVTAVVTVGVVK